MSEFDIIADYFRPLTKAGSGALDLLDDAAIISPGLGQDLVLTKDMMVSGTHFLAADPPSDIGWKLLAVNLSDLAAMGARPKGYLLGLKMAGHLDPDWIGQFVDGLRQAQDTFGLSLLGGDTVTGSGEIVLSLTAVGTVPSGGGLRRSGAREGDDIYVTGTLGDAALGLDGLTGTVPLHEDCLLRLRRPVPRIALGIDLAILAHAAADISDGLLQDLGHILGASGCGAEVHRDVLPRSPAVQSLLADNPDLWPRIYAGGDDYELVFTAPVEKRAMIADLGVGHGVMITHIGRVTIGTELRFLDSDNHSIPVEQSGFLHY